MIYIGADHRGFEKKSDIVDYLTRNGHPCNDLGSYVLDSEDDYNDSAIAVAKAVRENPNNFGILICGSAHGMVMQANRFKGVRAITANTEELVELGRKHNNANILCLSAEYLDTETMISFIKLFIDTNFINTGKYIRRNNRLDEREDYA